MTNPFKRYAKALLAAFVVALVLAPLLSFAHARIAALRPESSVVRAAAPAFVNALLPDGRAPQIGGITIGAFAPEAAANAGISDLSITAIDSDQAYAAYRQAVQTSYGAGLADMDYLGVGMPDWAARYNALGDWLRRASAYGDPTIAIEPVGRAGFGAFGDGPEMRGLRDVFAAADRSGITVWVRFASECNLRYSDYSVYNDDAKIEAYRKSVRWFRSYMPKNVRLVFSPLINTIYLQDPRQIRTVEDMYEPGAYDRIGGTIYATSWLRPKDAFDWYYKFMRRRDPSTPFQICELGGTYPRADEVKAFLVRVARGDWPGVKRVNLFAGDLNPLATSQHGHFGFILPGASTSYIADLFDSDAAHSTYAQLASDKALARLEAVSAGWRSADMTVEGRIVSIARGQGHLEMDVEFVTDELGERTQLDPARPKELIVAPECVGAEALVNAHSGMQVVATGWDSGAGTPLRATQVSLGASQ